MAKYVDINELGRSDSGRKKRHTGLIVTLIIIAALLAVLAVGIFMYDIDVIQFVKDIFDVREPADSIVIDKTEYEVGVGQIFDLDVTMTPKNTKSTYKIKSSDESILGVDRETNKIKAKKEGKCTLTAQTSNNLTAVTYVTVLPPPTSVEIVSGDYVYLNDTLPLSSSTPAGQADGAVTFLCKDNARATVNENGELSPILTGEVIVVARTYNGVTAQKKINIYKTVSKIYLNQSKLFLSEDTEYELIYKTGDHEHFETIDFSSDDASVATVDGKGKIKTHAQGKAVIKVFADNGVSAICEVTVGRREAAIRMNLNRTKPMVALTFDDGPSATNTAAILDTLKKYNAKSTFFVIGNKVQSNADLIRREYQEGHEVASHSWDHNYADSLTDKEMWDEIYKTDEAIYNVLSIFPPLFRCPGGIDSNIYTSQNEMPLISWSIDTKDWETQNSKSTYERITNIFKRGLNVDGDIILMHDIQDTTPEAVKNICSFLNKKGYQMVTVSELAYYRDTDMYAGETYSCFYSETPPTEAPTKETETKKPKETEEAEDEADEYHETEAYEYD